MHPYGTPDTQEKHRKGESKKERWERGNYFIWDKNIIYNI